MESAKQTQWIATAALAGGILATRVGHSGTFSTPPDATLAVFFLAGLWVRGAGAFVLMLAAAGLADQLAFAHGISDWCVTQAYVFLIPTYACPWLAGRASRRLDWLQPAALARGVGNLLSSLLAAFVISSGSFFLLAPYFPGISGTSYWIAVAHYLPHYVGWTFFYTGMAIALREIVTARLHHARTNAS